MKKLIYSLLLLPLFTIAQERQIGTYSGGVYSFNWNMEMVVENATNRICDTSFVYGSGLKIVFQDSGNIYSDYIDFSVINGAIYTAVSGGCKNSCWAVNCSDCNKTKECGCVCAVGLHCESKNLGIFGNINISNGIRNYILTHSNPEE